MMVPVLSDFLVHAVEYLAHSSLAGHWVYLCEGWPVTLLSGGWGEYGPLTSGWMLAMGQF